MNGRPGAGCCDQCGRDDAELLTIITEDHELGIICHRAECFSDWSRDTTRRRASRALVNQ